MELLAALALFLVETLIPVVVEIVLALVIEVGPEVPDGPSRFARKFARFCLVLAAGASFGWVSTLILPSLLLGTPALQLLNLIVGPLVAGFFAERISNFILSSKEDRRRYGNYWTYFWFTLAFLAMRLEIYYKDLSILF